MLDVAGRCDGELRGALDVLHAAADLSLTATEQLTLCTIALEALLLPELDAELKRTFARRLANLVGCEEAVGRAVYDARSETVHGEAAWRRSRGSRRRCSRAPWSRSSGSRATGARCPSCARGSTRPARLRAASRTACRRRPRAWCTRRRALGAVLLRDGADRPG